MNIENNYINSISAIISSVTFEEFNSSTAKHMVENSEEINLSLHKDENRRSLVRAAQANWENLQKNILKACSAKVTQRLEKLLVTVINICCAGSNGRTTEKSINAELLEAAILYQNDMLTSELLEVGVLEQWSDKRTTALHFFCHQTNLNRAILRQILEKEINIDAIDSVGRTAAMIISDRPNPGDALAIMHEFGANLNKVSECGRCIIGDLIQCGDINSIKQIIAAGWKPSIHTSNLLFSSHLASRISSDLISIGILPLREFPSMTEKDIRAAKEIRAQMACRAPADIDEQDLLFESCVNFNDKSIAALAWLNGWRTKNSTAMNLIQSSAGYEKKSKITACIEGGLYDKTLDFILAGEQTNAQELLKSNIGQSILINFWDKAAIQKIIQSADIDVATLNK